MTGEHWAAAASRLGGMTSAELEGLRAELDAGIAAADRLASLHEGIAKAAGHVADGTVALLSLMPLVGRDHRALDFLSDAMSANGAAIRALYELQTGPAAALTDAQSERVADLLSDPHSRKV